MLRILLVLTASLLLSSGPAKNEKQAPDQNPLSAFSSCEESYPPKACPPYCDCE
jgi:hypothetical protein